MKGQVDAKSLLVGLILGALITLSIAATQKSEESGPGRYKMLLSDKRVYIIDSQTGKPWSISADAGPVNSTTFWKDKVKLEK